MLLNGRFLLILQDHARISSALESFSQFTWADQLLHALQSLSTLLSPHHSALPWDLSLYVHICLSCWTQNISRKRAVHYKTKYFDSNVNEEMSQQNDRCYCHQDGEHEHIKKFSSMFFYVGRCSQN